MKLFIPLTKVDVEKREVYGVAAAEEADRSGEIFDYATSKPNFQKWSADFEKTTGGKSLGNIREMHGKVAAGKMISMDFDDEAKKILIGTKVVDDQVWKKVQEGVLTGFSIGGSYAKRWQDGDLKRYTASPSEISYVDAPCIPSATYELVKADGSVEKKSFKKVKPVIRLRKGMYGVSCLANVIQSLKNCQMDAEYESQAEGDKSDLPNKLQQAVEELGLILIDMAQEEVGELSPEGEEMETSEKIAKAFELVKSITKEEVAELAKAGKAISGKNMESVQAIHDHAADLGASHAGKHDAELKSDGYTAPEKKDSEAEKMLKQLISSNKELMERLAKVEAQPAATTVASPFVALEKGKSHPAAQIAQSLEKVQDKDAALQMLKASFENPIPLQPSDLVKVKPI